MSDTPRTDAEIKQARSDHGDMWYTKMPDLARQLERELAQARFSPMGDNHHNAMLCPYCNPLPAQRPEERQQLIEARDRYRNLAIVSAVSLKDSGLPYGSEAERLIKFADAQFMNNGEGPK